MNKLKIGVVGAGHLGMLHIKMFKQIENAQVIGVYDVNALHSQAAVDQYNVKKFNDLNSLLKEVDAVSIASTTSSHYEIAKAALENNIRVFIEKPITASIEQGEELVKLAKEKKLILQVGHIERFNPAIISVDKYFMNPMFIQTDRLAQFNPRGTDVAVVLDLMIHDIDIILSLIKSDVKDIAASGVSVVSDTLDIANARIEFENGAVANVTASRISQKKMRKMRIFQKDSYISLDFHTGVSEVYRLLPLDSEESSQSVSFGEIGVGEKKKKLLYEQPEIKEVNALLYELQLFVDAALQGTPAIVTGEDGLRALKVAATIEKKIEESKPFIMENMK
jgi:predicted dehydrogenase